MLRTSDIGCMDCRLITIGALFWGNMRGFYTWFKGCPWQKTATSKILNYLIKVKVTFILIVWQHTPPYKIQNHVNYVTFYLNYWFFIYSGLSVWPKLYHKIWLPIFSLLMNKDNRGNKDSFWKGVPFLKFIYRGHSTGSF